MIPFIVLAINYFYNYKLIIENKHINYNKIGLTIYKLFSNLLNIKQNIFINNIKYTISKAETKVINYNITNDTNRILLLVNHSNLLDCVNLQNFISTYYSNYMPVYIMTNKVKKIPIYGNWIDKHCILIENDIEYDKKNIENKCKELYNNSKNNKYIFILFPEGCLRNKKNRIRNNIWCYKNNIKPFKYLLNPRKVGFDLVLHNFKPQKVLLTSILYEDDLENTKSQTFYDMLSLNIAKKCNIYLFNISEVVLNNKFNYKKESSIKSNSKDIENSIIYKIWNYHNKIYNRIYLYMLKKRIKKEKTNRYYNIAKKHVYNIIIMYFAFLYIINIFHFLRL